MTLDRLTKIRERNKSVKSSASGKAAAAEYYQRNKGKIRERARVRYADNREETCRRNREYASKNTASRRERQRIYHNTRRRDDPAFRLSTNIRKRRIAAVKDGLGKKSHGTLVLTGCSWAQLREHLGSNFTDGMTWDNYGVHGWHVDHIKPCSLFDLTLESEQLKCFNYTNLQPLWAKDNLTKSDKY